ncbi:hypothetical protein B0H16DRAFT_317754 [Mycena metata]|uniref:Uncharacterized protein n=1 Tax=Mycena metata TaxID=1033252 RepID=A0AAD7NN76_9AGAR|nr:hypothetical protein B0H16DRAFT_317754 [Mycena metata]
MVDELPPVYTSSFVDTKSHGSTLGEKNGSASASSNSIAYKTAVLLQKDSGSSSTRTGLRDLFRKTLQPDLVSASVRAAVLHDLRLVVEPYTEDSVSERVAVLKSCAQLCTRHKIKFSRLLQENLVGDHTVLYWAIANAPWPPRAPFALVAAVLAHSAPLQPSTIREARRACVSLRTQDVFQFFRTSPEFRTLSEEDRYILGVAAPPEEIVVEEMEGDAQPFSVRFRIPMFHKRMMLGKEITLEFVARGRLFQIEFFTANKPTQKNLTHGSWSGLLRMAENSPTTPAIFGLVFLNCYMFRAK